METPNTIDCYGRIFELLPMPEASKAQGTWGMIDLTCGKIWVDQDLDLELFLKTLLHEVAHLHQHETTGVLDESEARGLASFIHDLLRHNPWIAALYSRERPGAGNGGFGCED